MPDPIYVTRPYLPPLNEFVSQLEGIWDRAILTNNGPLNREFEKQLGTFLEVPSVATVANGSLALELVIEAAELTGEVITTPYSFVATSHSILRAGLTPVFADIEADGFNIDPDMVERAITERTSAIIAVHCYGTPCNVDRLAAIAEAHDIALIYDAAHAFGVRLQERSIYGFGDYSTASFHATKVFHTFEGGAVAVSDPARRARIDSLRNFGITSETTIPYIGTNAKMSEIGAAMGLLQLSHFEEGRAQRAAVDRFYRERLSGIGGLSIPPHPGGVEHNFSYFPILITDDFAIERDALYAVLQEHEIFPRRYFYPLLSSLPMYRQLDSANPANLPVANRIANQILCLPIYASLQLEDLYRITSAIIEGAARA